MMLTNIVGNPTLVVLFAWLVAKSGLGPLHVALP